MSEQDGHLPKMNLTPDERLDVEQVLGQFAPRAPRLDREALLALAHGAAPAVEPGLGFQVRYRTPWYWPVATAAMTALSLTLAILLVARADSRARMPFPSQDGSPTAPAGSAMSRPGPPTRTEGDELAVAWPSQDEVAASEPLPRDHYLKYRDLALRQGVEAFDFHLPRNQDSLPYSAATRAELLRQWGLSEGVGRWSN
jgi:hypothetical protein